jgi:DHA1 family bicyclomycin/chloramphenicol resistance-like MFS transporter
MNEITARSGAAPTSARSAASDVIRPVTAAMALALLLGLQPVMTDLYLPALPLLARELAAPMSATQLTMSALILAFGLSQLVWGPVADRFGRRPVLLASLSLLVLASIAAATAPGIGWLIVWRAAQGAMMAAAVVCARAMVRDLYEPYHGARVMSLGLSGLGVLAISAPLLGGGLAMALGWRSALGAVAIFALIVLTFVWRALPETLAVCNPRALHGPMMIANAREVLTHRGFQSWALLVTTAYGGLFTLLAASSFAYVEVLGLTPAQYGVAMATGSLSYLLGTFVCRRWLRRVGLLGAVRRGGWFSLAGGMGMLLCALVPSLASVALMLTAQCLFMFGHGIHQPCGQTGAISPFPQMAGVAAALAGCVLALTAFAIGLWLGQAMDGTLAPMAFGIAFWAALTAIVAWTLVQRHGMPASSAG